MIGSRSKDEEELAALRAQRASLIWFAKHPDETVASNIRRLSARIKTLEDKTRNSDLTHLG
jgi:hypothetical protein